MTIAGWQLCIKWKDGSTDWVARKDIKQLYPVDLSYYAKRMKIDDDPLFGWWVPYAQNIVQILEINAQVWNMVTKFSKGNLCIG